PLVKTTAANGQSKLPSLVSLKLQLTYDGGEPQMLWVIFMGFHLTMKRAEGECLRCISNASYSTLRRKLPVQACGSEQSAKRSASEFHAGDAKGV
ncbi:hypothetical protein, partial [Arthrobacter psychrolactophilus]|uniref:hypothetical protein n=1 Tax=Arthrobacter psychrolactophilus TaxID=92442 RepID=UPI001C64D8D2